MQIVWPIGKYRIRCITNIFLFGERILSECHTRVLMLCIQQGFPSKPGFPSKTLA